MAASGNSRLTAANRLAARHEEVQREERREAIAALLANPLLAADSNYDAQFRLVRFHADWLKEWFLRWPGWNLIVTADIARLRKVTSSSSGSMRGLVDAGSSTRNYFTRRRYALLCLVLATLESEQRQTTLQQVARKTELAVRIDPALQEFEFDFDPKTLAHRRELVAVMRMLQRQNVLTRADGDDAGYVSGEGDCLYRMQRSALSTILCSERGASTIPLDSAAATEDFIGQLNEVEIPESPDAQNRQLQHRIVRRLLDDPVMYYDELTTPEYEYFNSQAERLARELARTTGMIVERRADGVALLDPTGDWTDIGLPETGTRGHATLLLAEWLGDQLRNCDQVECRILRIAAHQFIGELAVEHKSRWRKNADSPEGIQQILRDSLEILASLSLIEISGTHIVPRPAIARYRLGELVDTNAFNNGRTEHPAGLNENESATNEVVNEA